MDETHGITRVCPICGRQFEVNQSNKKYCSPMCAKEAGAKLKLVRYNADKERRREERRNRAGRIIDLTTPVAPHDCRREIRHTTDAEGRKVIVERRF